MRWRCRVCVGFVCILLATSLIASAGIGIAVSPALAQSNDSSGPGPGGGGAGGGGDSGGGDIPVGVPGGQDSGNASGPGAGGQPEEPPEGVSAGEYYDNETVNEWQSEVDDSVGLDVDVREMDAQDAHDIFVDGEGSGGVDDNETVDQVGPGGGVGGGGMTSAGDLLDGIAEWIVEASLNFIQWILAGTIELVIGTPVPENSGWLGIFGEPTNAPFDTLYGDLYEALVFPLTLSFFALAVLINASIMPFSSLISRYHASKWITLAFVSIIAIALAWPFMSALHALSDAVATTIAPSPEELTETTEGMEALLSGLGATGAAIYLTAGINLLVYALIYGMRYFLLLMVMPYVFGLALATSLFAPSQRLRSFGSGIIGLHIGLLLMSWPMALLFRGAVSIGWDFGFEGLANVLLTVGAFVAGVAIPIVIAYQMTRLTIAMRSTVRGMGRSTSIPSRQGTRTKLRNAGSRTRDIGRSARSRATTAAQATQSRLPVAIGSGGRGTVHESWGSDSSARGSRSTRADGGTQAARKRSAKKRMRLRKRDDGQGWTVEDK